MKKYAMAIMVLWIMGTLGLQDAQTALPTKVLLLSGLGEPDPQTAYEKWKDLIGTKAIIGTPNKHATSFSAYANSVRKEIWDAFVQAGHKKIGIIAHSIAATTVLDAILKDSNIRQNIIDRVVLISPIVSGIDGVGQDIDSILTFTGMSSKLAPSLEKGSTYYDDLFKLIANTSDRIEKNPTLLEKYPRILIIASKDDGMIPVSTSNPVVLQFVSGLKIRLGLRHGRFVSGKRTILGIKGSNDPVYKLAGFFLENTDNWQKIGREPNSKDKGEVVISSKGKTAYLKQNGKTSTIQLRQNTATKRYYLESLDVARYHVFVQGKDGGELLVGPAQYLNTPAPLPGVQSPTAVMHGTPTTGPVPLSISFDGSSSSDPDGYIVSYQWSYGDGGKGTGQTVSHTYLNEGTYTCQLTVTDDDDLTDTAQLTITAKGPNTPPIASFTVSPANGDTDTTFAFNGTSSSDPDGSIVYYEWDFGDKILATGSTATHKYSANGTYTATLKVTDNKGASDTETSLIKVSLPNQPPTAILSSSGASEGPLTVYVKLSATDSDGTVVSATIDFGDGTSGAAVPGQTYNYTYSKAGTFKIVCTATDNSGATTTSNALYVMDVDGDGWASMTQGDIRGSDCNDSDKTIHPGAIESPGDGKDSNCNGMDDF